MYEFVVDKDGIQCDSWEDIAESYTANNSEDEECVQNFIPLDEFNEDEVTTQRSKKSLEKNDISLDNTYLITNYTRKKAKESDKSYVDKILEKSILKPGFERELRLPVRKNKRALMRERRAIRDKTKGKNWYNLPATEVTEEIKNDLEVLKMRSALDAKHFYKKNDVAVTPKYFQVGRVVEGAADFYSGRIPKSQRKKTLVDELLADSNFRAYQKKKYKEIVDDNRRKKQKKFGTEQIKKKKMKDDWLSFD